MHTRKHSQVLKDTWHINVFSTGSIQQGSCIYALVVEVLGELGANGFVRRWLSCARKTKQAMANIKFCTWPVSSNAVLLLTFYC